MLAFGKLFFNLSQPISGISEVYPIQATDYAGAIAKLNAIAVARLALLSDDVHLAYAVVSDSAIRGDSVFVGTHVGESGSYVAGSAPHLTYEPETCLLFRLTTNDATKRGSRKLKFIPANLFTNAGVYSPYTEWTDALANWQAAVVAGASVATNLHSTTVPFYHFEPITQVTFNRQTSFKSGRPFGLIPGRRVIR